MVLTVTEEVTDISILLPYTHCCSVHIVALCTLLLCAHCFSLHFIALCTLLLCAHYCSVHIVALYVFVSLHSNNVYYCISYVLDMYAFMPFRSQCMLSLMWLTLCAKISLHDLPMILFFLITDVTLYSLYVFIPL